MAFVKLDLSDEFSNTSYNEEENEEITEIVINTDTICSIYPVHDEDSDVDLMMYAVYLTNKHWCYISPSEAQKIFRIIGDVFQISDELTK